MSGNTERPVFSLVIPIKWGDMDAYGHVNNTVYFRLFEEARIQWLTSLSLSADGTGTGPIIITTGATFLREMGYPANVRVELLTGRAGTTSLETFYQLVDNDTQQPYAEGYAKVVWFDHETRGSTALPDELRALAAE
ncbi:MAG: thioesterase family protein [Oleiphilaceae bacterium]|nr:thioesterase family protein [Oleiphilaceae bacterium]